MFYSYLIRSWNLFISVQPFFGINRLPYKPKLTSLFEAHFYVFLVYLVHQHKPNFPLIHMVLL